MRQEIATNLTTTAEYDPRESDYLYGLAREYPAAHHIKEHSHGSDQLIHAIRGVMQVSAGASTWFIPPHFALWVPAGTRHSIQMPAAISMRTVYFRSGLVTGLSPGCSVLHMTPLLRELILEVVRIGRPGASNRHHRALTDLTVLHLERASPVPVFVTLPTDDRALAVARALLINPAEPQSFAALCARSGASVRTIERAFRREVGVDFASWRRQLRLTRAIELLLDGQSVKQVAANVGYCQSSAFVEAFRRAFGSTPRAWTLWLQNLNAGEAAREHQIHALRD